MTKIRRINLFGGPCTRKSTLANYITSELKSSKYNCEHIQEFIKEWVYLKRKPESFDQFFVFANQLYKEDVFLRNGVNIIVTDAPLLLNIFYIYLFKNNYYKDLIPVFNQFEKKYFSLNIFLKRPKWTKYKEEGRYHTEKQAKHIDVFLPEFLKIYKLSFSEFSFHKKEDIVKFIFDRLKNK